MVKNYKYLRVIILNNLSWAEHIEMIKSKLLKIIGFFFIKQGTFWVKNLYTKFLINFYWAI